MGQDWDEITRLTQGQPFTVERIRLQGTSVAIEGSFELPPMAKLTTEDQVFVAAFIRSHGSIKEMEKLFGVSYPTIKNRLNRISEQLEFVEISPLPSSSEVLSQLERGEISAKDAIQRLKRLPKEDQ